APFKLSRLHVKEVVHADQLSRALSAFRVQLVWQSAAVAKSGFVARGGADGECRGVRMPAMRPRVAGASSLRRRAAIAGRQGGSSDLVMPACCSRLPARTGRKERARKIHGFFTGIPAAQLAIITPQLDDSPYSEGTGVWSPFLDFATLRKGVPYVQR